MSRAADTPDPVAIETYARYLPELIIEKVVTGEAVELHASMDQFRCAAGARAAASFAHRADAAAG